MEVEEVAAHRVAGLEVGVELPAGEIGGPGRQQAALDRDRGLELLRELASRLLGLEQARVLDLHRRHVREQGQHFELLLRERAGEVLAVHVDQPQHLLVVEQRHRHRRVDRLRDDALLRAEALVRGGVGGEHR